MMRRFWIWGLFAAACTIVPASARTFYTPSGTCDGEIAGTATDGGGGAGPLPATAGGPPGGGIIAGMPGEIIVSAWETPAASRPVFAFLRSASPCAAVGAALACLGSTLGSMHTWYLLQTTSGHRLP